jgi:rubrerythrin
MATTVGTERELQELVDGLIKLDKAAIEAYEAAIERLQDEALRTKMMEFRDDHADHVRALSEWHREHGIIPPDMAGPKQLLAKGKVAMAGLAGDKLVLQAIESNEEDTNTAYERATTHRRRGELEPLFERALADERRHRDWLVRTIDSL